MSRTAWRVRWPGTLPYARCPGVTAALDAGPQAYHHPAAVRRGPLHRHHARPGSDRRIGCGRHSCRRGARRARPGVRAGLQAEPGTGINPKAHPRRGVRGQWPRSVPGGAVRHREQGPAGAAGQRQPPRARVRAGIVPGPDGAEDRPVRGRVRHLDQRPMPPGRTFSVPPTTSADRFPPPSGLPFFSGDASSSSGTATTIPPETGTAHDETG
jgi:hypothetical protein